MESNPVNEVSEPKTPNKYPRVLTETQAQKLLKTAKKKSNTWTGFRNYTIVKCLLEMGLRKSELLNARMDDYEPSKHTLLVSGKGNKERKVACGPDTNKTLRKWLRKREEVDEIYDGTIFISKNGDRLGSRNLNRRITRIQEKAGLEDVKVSPHVLRHTAATLAAENGMSTFHLKEFFGWENVETAEKYVHISGKGVRESIAQYSPLENLD